MTQLEFGEYFDTNVIMANTASITCVPGILIPPLDRMANIQAIATPGAQEDFS